MSVHEFAGRSCRTRSEPLASALERRGTGDYRLSDTKLSQADALPKKHALGALNATMQSITISGGSSRVGIRA